MPENHMASHGFNRHEALPPVGWDGRELHPQITLVSTTVTCWPHGAFGSKIIS